MLFRSDFISRTVHPDILLDAADDAPGRLALPAAGNYVNSMRMDKLAA